MMKITGSLLLLQAYALLATQTVDVPTVKFRIGNPLNEGIFVVRSSSLSPKQLITVEYLPPKGNRYFDASLDMFFVPTDLVGLWVSGVQEVLYDDKRAGTNIPDRRIITDEMVNDKRAQVPVEFAQGNIQLWRIKQMRPGLTKVYLTVTRIDKSTLALMPNGTIQDGAVPEITFELWHDPAEQVYRQS